MEAVVRERAGVGVLAPGDLSRVLEAGVGLARKARAGNTQANYKSAQKQFKGFCAGLGVGVFPGEAGVVQGYLAWLVSEGYTAGSIRAKFSGVRRMYLEAVGKDNVTYSGGVLETYEGVFRTLDGRQEGAHPLSVGELKAMVDAMPEGTTWREQMVRLRDRALLLVGYSGAFRRSELSRMAWEMVVFSEAGMVIDLVYDKGNQRRTGQCVSIARTGTAWCPVAALEAWGEASGRVGAVFCTVAHRGSFGARGLTAAHISTLVGRAAGRVKVGRGVTAHSLRVGMVTELANAGLTDRQIMRLTRHKSVAMVARYDRGGGDFGMRYASVVGL